MFKVSLLARSCQVTNESASSTCQSRSTPLQTHCSFRFRCRRLGLTVLAYLWQRNQEALLQEMIDAGLVAVIIKVAGIGLTEKHLAKTLGEMQPTLLKLVRLFRSTTGHRHE